MKRQSGAVLVVALIFLLLITAIAASLMTSGSFETVIVANKQQREDIFQTAESAVDQIIPSDAAFKSAYIANGAVYNATAILQTIPVAYEKQYTVGIQMLKEGFRIAPQNSFSAGGGYQMYEVTGSANTVDNRIGTQLVLGLARYKPGASRDASNPYED